jgi:transposase
VKLLLEFDLSQKELSMEQAQNNIKKKHTPDQKFKIIKEQMTTKTTVTDICKKYDIHPSMFYKWQDKFLSGALESFKQSDVGPTKAELRKIEEQDKKILKMQSVITEVISENIELKKNLGASGLL